MAEKILRILAALTIGVWVTRYLGPEEFGILSYAQSFVGLFTALSSLGLQDILTRELLKEPQMSNTLLGTSFFLQTLGSCVIMIILFLSVLVNDNELIINKIIIILGLITFLQSFGVINAYFLSKVEAKFVVIPLIISLFISSILKVYFILNNFELLYFVYLLILDVAIIGLGTIYFYYSHNQSISKWKFSFRHAKLLLNDSWPLVLSGIVISIYMKIDQVMIKELLDNNSVGIYSAAVRLSEAWYFIPMVTCASLFPAILNAKLNSEKLYYSRIQELFDLMVLMAIVIIIPTVFLSDFLVLFLYGSKFSLTAPVLSIHLWASLFVFLGVANQKWFISENLQRYNMICLGLGLIVNLVLNFIWIPKFGIEGAAYATLVSQFVASVLATSFFKKTRPSFWRMIQSLLLISLYKRIFRSVSN